MGQNLVLNVSEIPNGWKNICSFAYDAKLGHGGCKLASQIGRKQFEKFCAEGGKDFGHRGYILMFQNIISASDENDKADYMGGI